MSLNDVLTEIKTVIRTVDGLKNVPDEPPEQVNVFPVALIYPGAGRYQLGSMSRTGQVSCWEFHTITIDIYQTRNDLPRDLLKIRPFARSVPAALMQAFAANRFNGTVTIMGDPQQSNGTWPIRYTVVMPDVGGINAVGYRFEIDVAFQEAIT